MALVVSFHPTQASVSLADLYYCAVSPWASFHPRFTQFWFSSDSFECDPVNFGSSSVLMCWSFWALIRVRDSHPLDFTAHSGFLSHFYPTLHNFVFFPASLTSMICMSILEHFVTSKRNTVSFVFHLCP